MNNLASKKKEDPRREELKTGQVKRIIDSHLKRRSEVKKKELKRREVETLT